MNEQLKQLVVDAGAPEELMSELWFNIFCQKFADVLLTQVEEEVFGETN